MLIGDFLPASPLREFIQCYRIVHFEFKKTDTIPIKAYPPKPEQCLHFFLRDYFAIENKSSKRDFQPAILLTGQQTSLVKQVNGNDFLDVQIVFQPTAIYRLTGIPAQELTNQFIDASLIFSHHIKYTFEQLQQATNYEQMLRTVEIFIKSLISHVRKDFHILDIVSTQMKYLEANSMDVLAKQSYLCTKQFKRKFQERTGINPKTYSRIIRFNKAYNLRNRFITKSWSLIASKCGYTDYQHLSKDYLDFTGLTPHEFHLLEGQSPESVLKLTELLYKTRALY
jgi:AraC-like DNA-binding protein